MAYTSGFLKDRITIQNRTEAQMGDFGLDSTGVTWENTCCLHANVEWQKGKSALREGAIDAYGVVLVRMRYTDKANMRSRIIYNDETYQIIPETFHADKHENTVQFMAQIIINDN